MVSITKQKFLSFQLGEKDTAVIPLEQITEVLPISLGEICRVPQMHSCVLGIYNWRSEMLWLVDLDEMFGYQPTFVARSSGATTMAVVVEKQDKYLGLIVHKLLDIELLDTTHINPPDHALFNSQVSRIIQGYFINDSQEMVLALDTSEIFQSSLLVIHNS
ncbi:chemotaxis protein CheW [Aetokthonos hydrillicola Thurmond2011]|jgi:positive phototaxis protein PixI|uniref:Chemotaxis protein CheW n=1 Tax=Aetokthonos hydrillicola Thurmond2011 TaxID=2712845 RepID=A0AAP5I9W5_9CYAN|nr:chemotaxis protein CheW [Aetokthonos hydrillicola]MBO3461450.1 chemotaxis protein CheW [Aetokthonos hydrillicola CCALA 1050]MBW4588792.1 chemotaxis protein CheW [Aetokthonos hydrillicola CCALA 1050]MDR9897344.1 chemotaxis protein CheW [Aetokthonos hydrillicola Thurmond2011]